MSNRVSVLHTGDAWYRRAQHTSRDHYAVQPFPVTRLTVRCVLPCELPASWVQCSVSVAHPAPVRGAVVHGSDAQGPLGAVRFSFRALVI
eukprot:2137302-Prymnesium_polylepis.2